MKTHGASAAVAMLRDSVCTRGWQGSLQEQGRFAGAVGEGCETYLLAAGHQLPPLPPQRWF